MKTRVRLFLLVLLSTLLFACTAKPMLSNLRTALDQDGKDPVSSFSPSDTIFAVADLNKAPTGTTVVVKWIAVEVEGLDPDMMFQEQTMEVPEDNYTSSIFFQVSVAEAWPTGKYKVEMYLNGTLSQTVDYTIE